MNMNGSTTVRKGSDIKLEGLAIKEGRPSDESRFAKVEHLNYRFSSSFSQLRKLHFVAIRPSFFQSLSLS